METLFEDLRGDMKKLNLFKIKFKFSIKEPDF